MSLTAKHLTRLKVDLKNEDISSTLSFLSEATDVQSLVQIREQKLLLLTHTPNEQTKLANAYKAAVARLLCDQIERERAEKYADFTVLLSKLFRRLTIQANKLRRRIQYITSIELLGLIDKIIVDNAKNILNWHQENVQRLEAEESLPSSELSDISEWMFHNFNGAINDLSWAGARTLNECILFTDSSKRKFSDKKLRSALKDDLLQLMQIAGNWNSLVYGADMVSYGEWFIEELIYTSPITVKFSISDISFARAKTIGIRRTITERHFGKDVPRPMRQMLEGFTLSTIVDAVDYYLGEDSPASFTEQDLNALQAQAIEWLALLNTEDELLLGAAKNDFSILGHYLAAIALRCFSHGAAFVGQHVVKKYRKLLICPNIPIDLIVELIARRLKETPSLAREWIETQILELPTPRYFEIINKPFIKLSPNQVVGFGNLTFNNWPPTVRASLIKGGILGKSYGHIWEQYISHNLKSFGWKILGCGNKIRNENQILTDVDILAFKNGLLLIIQVKAIAAGGANIYEHWKARNTIVEGTKQASTADREIKINTTLLNYLLSSNRIKEEVVHFQPIVITSSPLFTGWSNNNVPVISFGYLMTLLHGAQVKYTNPQGVVVKEKQYAKGIELTSEEFIQLLQHPLDWQIAKEGNEIEHRWVELEQVKLAMPELRRDVTLS
jgi:hypothetical protein